MAFKQFITQLLDSIIGNKSGTVGAVVLTLPEQKAYVYLSLIDIFKNIEAIYLDDSIFDSKIINDFKFVFPEIIVINNKKQLRKLYYKYFK